MVKRLMSSRSLLIGVCVSVLTVDAMAGDMPLGLYAGAGVGTATMSQRAKSIDGPPYYFSNDRTSWKLMVGIRPRSWLGAEFEYIDFGKAHIGPATQSGGGLTAFNQLYGADATAHASALFAVGYLPLGLSKWDVFGKAGIADLRGETSYSGNFPNVYSNCTSACVAVGQASISERSHSTGFAFGVGTQFNLQKLSLRLEYEHMNSGPLGNPQFTSASASWKF